MKGDEVCDRQEGLFRELSLMENGPLAELEKSTTERKRRLAKAREKLDTLMLDLTATRLEMERRDAATASSRDGLESLRKRVVEVFSWCGWQS